MSDRMLMRDGLSAPAVNRIADALAKVLPTFDRKAFRRDALRGLGDMELKARVDHLIRVLQAFLPQPFTESAAVLKRISEVWDRGDPDDPLRGFAAWPMTDYVGRYGTGDVDVSMDVLRTLTPLFSAEFAIRPFLDQNFPACATHLHEWVGDPDEHVRRLVSEGTRPRLPWGMRLRALVEDPTPSLPLLEVLKDDPSEYVRRSVANHLNDIAKDHPDLVISICSDWLVGASEERRRLVRHALRSIVKSGHPKVFPLLGYTARPKLTVENVSVAPALVRLGEALHFVCDLHSAAASEQKLVLDYVVHFVKANGSTNPKVFKLSEITLEAGAVRRIERRHMIRPISTRRYYSGRHRVELQVNGLVRAGADFELRV